MNVRFSMGPVVSYDFGSASASTIYERSAPRRHSLAFLTLPVAPVRLVVYLAASFRIGTQ
jgi:hypothetical protein